jgi:hypothetical protein
MRAHCADGAFAEVEDFVTRGWAFAGDGGHVVLAVEMVHVSPVAQFHTLKQLVGDIRGASGIEEGGEPVHAGEDAVLNGVRRHTDAGRATSARRFGGKSAKPGRVHIEVIARIGSGTADNFDAPASGTDPPREIGDPYQTDDRAHPTRGFWGFRCICGGVSGERGS